MTIVPNSRLNLFLVFLLVAVLAFGAIWLFNTFMGDKPYSAPWSSKRPRAEVEAACREHISDAEGHAKEAIEHRAAEFSEFIDTRKSGAKDFSKAISSYYGKWRAAKPYLPFTKDDSHLEYVNSLMVKHIFSQEDLANALRRSIEECIKDLEGIENNLAVALRQELLGRTLAQDEYPVAAEEFKVAMAQLIEASKWDAQKTAANLVISEAVAAVASQVLIRLGVLSAGAATSWWSLGVSILIAIMVDALWEWYDDPAGDIERKLLKALDDLSINGHASLVEEMTKFMSDRSNIWSQTVVEGLS